MSIICPLFETVEMIDPNDDTSYCLKCITYDWLIFTSQNAVQAFLDKLVTHQVNYGYLFQGKIAASVKKQHKLY